MVKTSLGTQGGSVSGERTNSRINWWRDKPTYIFAHGRLSIRQIEAIGQRSRKRYGTTSHQIRTAWNPTRFVRNQRHVSPHIERRSLMASQQVPAAVLKQTNNLRLRQSMLLGSSLEGGWNAPYPVGDQGTSFGPYQMHEGGALTQFGLTPSQAENASTATKYMLPVYASAVNQISDKEWKDNPEQAAEQSAVIAENPAQDYYSSQGTNTVNQNWTATQQVLKGKKSRGGMPAQSAEFTSAGGISNLWNDFLGLFGLATGNPGAAISGLTGGGFGNIKSDLERIGLVVLGGILIVIGLIVFVIPAARKATSEAVSTAGTLNRGVSAVGALSGATARNAAASREADVARRQGIANRSLQLGEQKIALQRQKEERLTRRDQNEHLANQLKAQKASEDAGD